MSRRTLEPCGQSAKYPTEFPDETGQAGRFDVVGVAHEVEGSCQLDLCRQDSGQFGGRRKREVMDNPQAVASNISACIERQLNELSALSTEEMLDQRYQRLLSHGQYRD